ncbi:MAG: hypothetical protein JWO02_4006 [Solirubrobacterales bacterium]|nr:hypothetical protein [Solirubrobacterales bacterium]
MGKRSRKRVGAGERRAVAAGSGPSPAKAGTPPKRVPRTKTGRRIDERPKPLWHPWPLTEIAIGLGVVFFLFGFLRGADRGSVYIGVGVLMATAGVIELCAREHFSGFKSHTLLLAFLPVVALHTVIRLWITDAYEGPLSLLADMAIFAALAMLLLDRYRKARPRKGR